MCTSVCPTSFGFLSTFLLLLLLSQLFWTTFQCSHFLYPLISVSFILSVFFFFSCCLLLWPLPLLFSTFFYVCCYFNQPACHHTVTIWDVREEQNKKLKRKRERGKKKSSEMGEEWGIFAHYFDFAEIDVQKASCLPLRHFFCRMISKYTVCRERGLGSGQEARGMRTTLDEKDRSCKGKKRNHTDQE